MGGAPTHSNRVVGADFISIIAFAHSFFLIFIHRAAKCIFFIGNGCGGGRHFSYIIIQYVFFAVNGNLLPNQVMLVCKQ